MNFFCQSPKYLLGESFIGFLASFESFCESVEAPDAAKRHAFLASLPETMKFEMQDANKQLYELTYDALKQKAIEVASGAKQSQTKRCSSELAAARQSENQIKVKSLRCISWERLHIPIRKTPKQKTTCCTMC